MNPYLAKLAGLSMGQALVAAGFVGLIYWQMAYDDGARFDKQVATLKTELAKELEQEKETDRAIAQLDKLKQNYEALTEQFKMVSSQIPVDMQMPEIIKTVDTMAKTSGITIKTKEPRAAIREDILEVFPIRVVAEGSFAEMTMFFYNLSTIDRIYRVKNFVFTAPDERRGAAQAASKRLTMDAEITSFRFAGVQEEDPAETKRNQRRQNRNRSSR